LGLYHRRIILILHHLFRTDFQLGSSLLCKGAFNNLSLLSPTEVLVYIYSAIKRNLRILSEPSSPKRAIVRRGRGGTRSTIAQNTSADGIGFASARYDRETVSWCSGAGRKVGRRDASTWMCSNGSFGK